MLKEIKTPPKLGDERIVKKFAIFPIYEYDIFGKYYFCWWEHYFIKQKYIEVHHPATYGEPDVCEQWITIDRWIDVNICKSLNPLSNGND